MLHPQNGENSSIQDELEEMTDRYKRLAAEFDNYKKRSNKEKEVLYASLVSDILSSFLPVMDNLEKATTVETKDENYKVGVELVLKQILDILKGYGVEEIKSVGEKFDPELHEAVSHIQDENFGEQEVTQEFRKGYKIGNKIIRHAMVIVAN